MREIISWAVGLAVFGFWMTIVGNPHVVETVIGLCIGAYLGYRVYKLDLWSKSSK